MTWDSSLEDLMPHTVMLSSIASVDQYAKPTYGTSITYTARVIEKMERVVDMNGYDSLSNTVVWIAPNETYGLPVVDSHTRITLQDGSNPPILNFEKIPDETGYHHIKIYCGSAHNRSATGV